MNYLALLTDSEIHYICSIIPERRVSNYFRHFPKEFSKICPGFRPYGISRLNVSDLLYRNRNNRFVSSFIEQTIFKWLTEIQEYFDECKKEGNSKDAALIRTLAQSYFFENTALYFKLVGEEVSEIYTSLLTSATTEAKKTMEELENKKAEAESNTAIIERLQSKLVSVTNAMNDSKSKQNKYATEIESLKQKLDNLDKLNAIFLSKAETNVALKAEIARLKRIEKSLRAEIKAAHSDQILKEARIKIEVEKKLQIDRAAENSISFKPLRPIDMDEFKEYLGYNLKDIGADSTTDCQLLLKHHLSEILFQGKPIIINRGTGVPLMKCIANTLVGNTNVSTLTYGKDISADNIETFLFREGRIICLDGFFGNYSETELLSLVEQHRNKIIFFTLAFDRTLQYVPYEIFRYCHYLNLNRIQTLSTSVVITEDPSIIEESEADIPQPNSDARLSHTLREVLSEFGLSPGVTPHKCARINNELDLCCTLAFDVLPYSTDVMHIAPFVVSERLAKYAGDKGRCPYKDLFKEWFA